MNAQIQEKVLSAGAAVVNKALDDEITKLDRILDDGDELQKLRTKRMQELRKSEGDKARWRQLGHGNVAELTDEKDFFRIAQESERVVLHFSLPTNRHSDILHQHMQVVARNHLETRFAKINADASPFLTARLNVRIIPAILLFVDGKLKHGMNGLSELSADGSYTTKNLEQLLFSYQMLLHQQLADTRDEEDD
eukprot:c15919_g1_i1.p1 GENE.c15919_g1_i1~~c15919_g1_i1.p1  ORF type:complete len:218 (+),score=58.72 c15919_g1_i1:73-654(+)